MYKIYFLLVIFFSINALAAKNFNEDEVYKDLSRSEQEKLYNLNESNLRDFNSSLGMMSDEFKTQNDSNRLSFAAALSSNYESFSEIQTIELKYMHRFRTLTDLWGTLNLKKTDGKFSALSNGQKRASTDPNAESNIKRDDETQNLTLMGFGVGYRFKIFTQAFKSHRFFEMITANLNYATNKDGKTGRDYKGLGYVADYEIHYRSSKSFFYGLKYSYSVVELNRAPVKKESYPDRSLNFSMSEIGFVFGYFY